MRDLREAEWVLSCQDVEAGGPAGEEWWGIAGKTESKGEKEKRKEQRRKGGSGSERGKGRKWNGRRACRMTISILVMSIW
jgi:hypothetical protein